MSPENFQCPACRGHAWETGPTLWRCLDCRQEYPCIRRIPKLLLENALGGRDRHLRDQFYDGLLGRNYQQMMPFLSLPVRPAAEYWKGWVAYAAIVLSLVALFGYVLGFFIQPGEFRLSTVSIAAALLSFFTVYFFYQHPYLFYLILLAIPVKISVLLNPFKPFESFQEIHARILKALSYKRQTLQILDISTGTCNSLYRHGWMQLDAEYTALDFSETMLLQGQAVMSRNHIPVTFVLGDAARLPFQDETFDVALNYGALNGYTNPQLALEEMARVTKKGGLLLFLDEQLYESASFVEKLYFKKVLSSHNLIHRCPVELMPATLQEIQVYQVYQFYYLCTARKK